MSLLSFCLQVASLTVKLVRLSESWGSFVVERNASRVCSLAHATRPWRPGVASQKPAPHGSLDPRQAWYPALT